LKHLTKAQRGAMYAGRKNYVNPNEAEQNAFTKGVKLTKKQKKRQDELDKSVQEKIKYQQGKSGDY
jgi:hypothetical protein